MNDRQCLERHLALNPISIGRYTSPSASREAREYVIADSNGFRDAQRSVDRKWGPCASSGT
jgi:hypothetical protein